MYTYTVTPLNQHKTYRHAHFWSPTRRFLSPCSIIVVPKDKYGNAIQVSDDMSSLALALTPPAGVLLNPAVNATTYSIKTGTAAVFAFKLSVSMVVPAGTYVAAPSAHGAPLNASGLTTVLGAALAFPSVTDWSQVPGLNASAGSPFSYVVQGRNGGNISLTFGGEGSAISVAMCSPARTTHTTAACPAFQQVAWTVLDYDNGNYLITVTAPPDVGTYQVQTRVNNVVLTEPVKTLNVLPPPPPPTPAPTPPGQTNITGVGLFTLLNRTVTPTAHNQSFSFADVNATLQPGLAFLFLLAAPANVTSVPPATFRSVPGPSPGLYSVNLATNYGGQYNLFVYLCGQPTCYDVMSAGNQLQTSARPILNLTESFPAGALSSFATTVDVASSIPLANAPSVLRITAKDAQRVVRAQQREASRFKVTADHALLTSPVVVDNLDGTYDAQFVPTEVAKYAVSVLLVSTVHKTLADKTSCLGDS